MIPPSINLSVEYDRSIPIRKSVDDVQFTLLLAIFLVILVIFLFLRNISATIMPSLALPMSIVGTFAVMYLFGYTIDTLSLLALILSVGFVVDDAIVMLENIVRHREMGKGALQGGARWLERNRLHHCGNDAVPGRRLSAGVFHARRVRTPAPRVCGGYHFRGDGFRPGFRDAYPDAVQALPAAGAREAAQLDVSQVGKHRGGVDALVRGNASLGAATPRSGDALRGR